MQRSGGAGDPADQTKFVKPDDHLVDDRRAHVEIALDICLRRRASVHLAIGIDERQILSLKFREVGIGQLAPNGSAVHRAGDAQKVKVA